jgi:aspartate/methionine/tyrosine aminotransferase
VQIEPFELERFYQRWEFSAELMLSSSDCESRPLGSLLELEPDALDRLLALRLGYTEVPGSPESRAAIAALYDSAQDDDVLTLAAAEEGIFTAYHALLGAGDHVVIEAPCYGSAVTVARSTGAEVSLWQRRYEDGWVHDLDELERLLRPDTRMLYLNSPHNPTGTQMPRETFERLLEMLRSRGTLLFSDEVYRGLEHDPSTRLPAACDAYELGISLGTVSKAHGLPGLRIGWLACTERTILARIAELKLYTTICSSAPSELLVALALRHSDELVDQSRRLIAANLVLVEDFIERHGELLEWVPPNGGPIGFPRIRDGRDVREWCESTALRAGVLLLPGDVYGQPEHIRVGFGRAGLAEALERLEGDLAASG